STIITQLNKKEAETRKSYIEMDLKGGKPETRDLLKQRGFIYTSVDSVDEIKKVLDTLEKQELKPVVKFKIKNASSIDLNLIEKNYAGKAIMVFQREISKSFDEQKTEILRKQMNAEEYGLSLIKEKSKLGNSDELLEFVLEENLEGVERVLRKSFEEKLLESKSSIEIVA
ncbi:MAG: hypothetical protein NT055_00025, partial [Nitrospirae bacterium]|nr:hypothetical protein [Nitrospirota bacterium]